MTRARDPSPVDARQAQALEFADEAIFLWYATGCEHHDSLSQEGLDALKWAIAQAWIDQAPEDGGRITPLRPRARRTKHDH